MIGADWFLFFLGLIWVTFATISDIRKREVPNWLNFSLIVFALAFRYFYSIFFGFDYFLQGFLGFTFFFALAHLFYYGKVFAGGDAKLLMGLGAILPMFGNYLINFKMMIYFVLVFMVGGSIYGIIYSVFLVCVHWRDFVGEFAYQFRKKFTMFLISLFFAVAAFVLAFYAEGIAWILPGILLLLPFLYIYAKSIEEACMVRKVDCRKLTEGDWLYDPIKVGNKIILPRWEGLTKRQVILLKGTKRKILIKEGIPFVPAFFFAYLLFFWKFVF